MRFRNQFAVFVFAILVGRTAAVANDGTASATVRTTQVALRPVAATSTEHQPVGMSFNGFAQFRQTPDLGAPGSAGSGFRHFTMPMHSYTTWYRPRAATLNECVRCEKDPFRPRGFGHLFARPCDGYRMEYAPHVLSGDTSTYGPAYIARQPDPRCPDCDHTAQGHHH